MIDESIILIVGSLGMILLVVAIIGFIYLYQRKLFKKKIAYKEIEDLLREQELKSTQALMIGQDLERKRISEELHDNLGSILVTLKMFTDTALSTGSLVKKDQLIGRIGELAGEAADETRKLSHKLVSAPLKHFGVKTALEDLANVVMETRSIDVHTSILLDRMIDNKVSLNIYRIVQELINNTLKHAKAKGIRIELHEIGADHLSLIYSDDGIGFQIDHNLSGLGLRNISARVEQIEGEMSMESNNNGTYVTIEIPLK